MKKLYRVVSVCVVSILSVAPIIYALEVGNNLILDPLSTIEGGSVFDETDSGTGLSDVQKQQVIAKIQEEARKYPFSVDKDDAGAFRGRFLYHHLYVNKSMILYQFRTEGIAQQFVDANNQLIVAQPKGKLQTKAVFNYFIGDESQWKSDLPSFSYLSLGNVYPNIEVLLRNQDGFLQKIVYVKPGGSVSAIRSKIDGDLINLIRRDNGTLEVKPGVVFSKPIAFQYIDSTITYIDINYEVVDSKHFSFTVGTYNTDYPLIITSL